MKFGLILFAILFMTSCTSILLSSDIQKMQEEAAAADEKARANAKIVAAEKEQADKIAKLKQEPEVDPEEPMTRYSELNNMAPPTDRQYKRMTRKKMEEESELYSSAGSLWKMDGQTSYLFAENKHRREGDMTNIKVEGPAMKLIENKAMVISDLLKKLEIQRLKAEDEQKKIEAHRQKLAQMEEERKLRLEKIARGEIVVDPLEEKELMNPIKDDAVTGIDSRSPAAANEAKYNIKDEKVDLKEVASIPSKIIETVHGDGYRIRGQQYLTIKNKSYRVIATGIIRTEDFKDDVVSSNKLLDAQYEIVHVKRIFE